MATREMSRWMRLVLGMLMMPMLLAGTSCMKREFRKYSSVEQELGDFSLLARLTGTYYRHEKLLVREPYSLFISVRPNTGGDFQIENIALSDSDKKHILNIPTYHLIRKFNSVTSSAFFCFEKTSLHLEYNEHDLTFDVLRDGVLLKKVRLTFKKDYSERRMSKWWEDASSI